MTSEMRPPLRITPQTLIGMFVVLVGLALTADNLGLADAGRVLAFWPILAIVVGISMFTRATDERSRLWAGFVTFVGVWLLAGRVLDAPLRLSVLLPVGLVVLGVMIIRRASGIPDRAGATSDQVFSDFAFWSGVERRVSSQMFRRADVTAVMGGIEMDFRPSAINGDAVIDVFVVMGGLQIRVPPDWTVSNQVMAIMGGAVDKSTGSPDAKNRLIIRGFVMMGGVEVKT